MKHTPLLAENYATQLVWRDGKPVVIGKPIIDSPIQDQMRTLMEEAMNLPYDGEDQRYIGLTKGQAIVVDLIDQASLGDKDARKEVLDRVLGKPVQNIKSVTLRTTLEDFLDNLDNPTLSTSTVDITPNSTESSIDGVDDI